MGLKINNTEDKRLPNLDSNGKISSNNGGQTSAATSIKHKSNAPNSEAELPRLTGTKSQASTASSSATRDSGISVNDVQRAAEAALSKGHQHKMVTKRQSSKNVNKAKGKASGGHQLHHQNNNKMISVDDLPVSGRAMPLGKRPGTNRSSIVSSSNFIDSGNESRSTTASTGGTATGMAAGRIRSVVNAEFEKRPPVRYNGFCMHKIPGTA